MKKMTWSYLPGKKLTIELVRNNFEKQGYKLLTTRYKNAFQKLEFICPEGHRHRIPWNSWQQGSRCRICKYANHKGRSITLSYEFIKEQFKNEGYKLLTPNFTYITLQKLKFQCSNGHIQSVSWGNWHQGQRCTICKEKIRKDRIFKKVRQSFQDKDCILLATEYFGAKSKINYICPNGHNHSITWNDWQTGYRCSICRTETMNGSGNPNFGNGNAIRGKKNPNWRHGAKCEVYCPTWEDSEFREFIYDRDKDKFCWNPECLGKDGRRVRHHIDYIKKNCDPLNIITICNSCNSRANFNRDYWRNLFSEVMRNRYDFKIAIGV